MHVETATSAFPGQNRYGRARQVLGRFLHRCAGRLPLRLTEVELVEVACRARQAFREATDALADTRAELCRVQALRRPAVDPPQYAYSRRSLCRARLSVSAKWEVVSEPPCAAPSTSQTLVPSWDWEEKRVRCYQTWWNIDFLNSVDFMFHRLISSPLLWYRLCCIFETTVQPGQCRDIVWEYYIMHRASGIKVGFRDGLTGSFVWMDTRPPSNRPSFDEDWLQLLQLLLDRECPRPWDHVVAGSIGSMS